MLLLILQPKWHVNKICQQHFFKNLHGLEVFNVMLFWNILKIYGHFSFYFLDNCSSGHPAFVRRPFVWLSSDSLPSEFIIQVHESPPSACFGLCAADKNCSAYFVDYRNQSCLIVKEQYDLKLIENKLVKDTVGSYHRKICLPGKVSLSSLQYL